MDHPLATDTRPAMPLPTHTRGASPLALLYQASPE